MTSIFNYAGKIALPIWGIGMVLTISCLMVGHWVNLPQPSVGDSMPVSLIAANVAADDSNDRGDDSGRNGETQSLTAFHFLYGSCPCSRRVLRHLVDRHPIDGVDERIVLIDEDPEMEARAIEMGYQTDVVTPEQLQNKYGVESAPLMVVADQSGAIVYSGGYTSRKQGFNIQDVELIRSAMNDEDQQCLPVYGCAVSQRLKNIVDPLGLKN